MGRTVPHATVQKLLSSSLRYSMWTLPLLPIGTCMYGSIFASSFIQGMIYNFAPEFIYLYFFCPYFFFIWLVFEFIFRQLNWYFSIYYFVWLAPFSFFLLYFHFRNLYFYLIEFDRVSKSEKFIRRVIFRSRIDRIKKKEN